MQGLRKQGGRGVNCPPTFHENRAKLVNNRQISAEIWFLPPHFWVLTPHFSVPSEGPDNVLSQGASKLPEVEVKSSQKLPFY